MFGLIPSHPISSKSGFGFGFWSCSCCWTKRRTFMAHSRATKRSSPCASLCCRQLQPNQWPSTSSARRWRTFRWVPCSVSFSFYTPYGALVHCLRGSGLGLRFAAGAVPAWTACGGCKFHAAGSRISGLVGLALSGTEGVLVPIRQIRRGVYRVARGHSTTAGPGHLSAPSEAWGRFPVCLTFGDQWSKG